MVRLFKFVHINSITVLFFIVISSLYISSCEDKIEFKDGEVSIITTFNSTGYNGIVSNYHHKNEKYANVVYTIHNTGDNTIIGWKVYFNVSLERGSPVTVGGKYTGTIEPGETSSEKVARGLITTESGNAVSSTLKLFEAW